LHNGLLVYWRAMAREQVEYASYLLRLWRTERDGRPVWHASLEGTFDGQRLNFSSLEALISFLEGHFGLQGRGGGAE
jgi:hypothetical protein